jgi:hypothetical protein
VLFRPFFYRLEKAVGNGFFLMLKNEVCFLGPFFYRQEKAVVNGLFLMCKNKVRFLGPFFNV